MTRLPEYWTRLCRLLEHGRITQAELVGSFLDEVDVAGLEQQLRSLPTEFLQQFRDYLKASPRVVPGVSWYGASPAQLEESLQVRAERAALVREALKRLNRS